MVSRVRCYRSGKGSKNRPLIAKSGSQERPAPRRRRRCAHSKRKHSSPASGGVVQPVQLLLKVCFFEQCGASESALLWDPPGAPVIGKGGICNEHKNDEQRSRRRVCGATKRSYCAGRGEQLSPGEIEE